MTDGCGGIWFAIAKQDLCLLLRAEELSLCLYTCVIGKGKICPARVIFVSCGLQLCNLRGKEARGCLVGPPGVLPSCRPSLRSAGS